MGGPTLGYVRTMHGFFKLLALLIGIRLIAAYVTAYFFFEKGIGGSNLALAGVVVVGLLTAAISIMFTIAAGVLVIDVLKRRRIQYKGAFTLTLGFLIATHALGLPYLFAWKVLFEEPAPPDASVPDPYLIILFADTPGVACVAVAVLIAFAVTMLRSVSPRSQYTSK